VGLAVAIELFGQVLQVSHWVLDISSFTHSAAAGRHGVGRPLLWLSGGARARRGRPAGLRRHDIG
jgi:hypothetical protein